MRKTEFKQREMQSNNDAYNGQSVERYIEQAEASKQPITGDAPIIYTARKDGVMAEYNIRTDRWETAQRAMDKVSKSYQAKRADWIKSQEPKQEPKTEETNKESA